MNPLLLLSLFRLAASDFIHHPNTKASAIYNNTKADLTRYNK